MSLVYSFRAAVAGAVLLCTCVLTLVVALPRTSPFEVIRCVSPGQTACFSGVNPAYPFFFLMSVTGMVISFFGVFGRSFVFNPVFVAGTIALAYGLSGVVSAALDAQRAVPVDPAIFGPLIVIGSLAIGFQTYRRLRRTSS